MRLAIFLAALLTLSSASAIVQTADLGATASTHVAAAEQPSGQAKIDVNIIRRTENVIGSNPKRVGRIATSVHEVT